MNFDRLMLTVVMSVIIAVFGVTVVAGIADGTVVASRLAFAMTVCWGLQYLVVVARRRLSLSDYALYFLSTVTIAAVLAFSVNHRTFNLGDVAKSFLVIEVVLLAIAAVAWPIVRRKTEF